MAFGLDLSSPDGAMRDAAERFYIELSTKVL